MDSMGNANYINWNCQKNNQYLLHFQLVQYHDSSISMMLRFNVLILIVAYFWTKYDTKLISLDLVFCILGLVFYFVIKPKILKGKIKAYYRRDYNRIRFLMFLGSLFVYGGILRTPVWIGYYALQRYFAQHQSNFVYVRYYDNLAKQVLLNPLMMLIAVIFMALFVYFLFFQDKYVSIEYFSKGVIAIYSNTAYNYTGAMQEFIRLRDNQLERNFINQTIGGADVVQSHTVKKETSSEVLPPEDIPQKTGKDDEPVAVRRKSRR